MKNRDRQIVWVSILGILLNLVLVAFKTLVGILSNSIAIVLDAANNLSDVMSSIVTIVGTRLASKGPDKNHPMGHGRSEYLGTVIIAILIIYIGLAALVESIKKIINPVPVDYGVATIIVVSAAIIIKVFISIFFRARGKKLESGSLIGSGIDALCDAFISLATLIAIIIFFATGLQIEAYLAAGISLFIIFSGYRLIRNAFSTILGERVDAKLSRSIKDEIAKIDGVNEAFDLAMHDYGSGKTVASVNIEVNRRMPAYEIDKLSRKIQQHILKKYNVAISSVGIYAIDLENPTVEKLWRQLEELRDRYEHILQIHGFHVDIEAKEINFDVVIDFAVEDRQEYYRKFCRELGRTIPDYQINAQLDLDISD